MSEYLTDSLNQRYRAALALVAFLVLLNQLLVQPSLMRLTTDAPVINIAGRQRMLSQRLAKAALAFERADGTARIALLRRAGAGTRALDGFPRWAASWQSRRCRCRAGTVKP